MKSKQCLILILFGLFTQVANADSELQIRLNTITTGDTEQKVLAILGHPATQETNQWLGMTCNKLTFNKKNFMPEEKVLMQEEATITLCFNRVVATKFATRSLLGL